MFLTNKGSDFYDVRSTVKGMRSARSSNGRPLIEAQPGRERSAEEARKLVLTTQQPAHLDRYLHRSESSPFPPEYSFYLLGDVRGKTVLDLGCGSGEIPLVRHGANVIIFLRNLSNWPRSGSTQLEQRLPSKSVQLMKPV